MTDKIFVLTTVDKEDVANKIATSLVDRRLAACVNLVPAGVSIYRWKGKVHRDREYLLLIKTAAHLFNAVRDTIREIHTYELPEILALPVAVGDERVLQWISDSVQAREN